VHSCAVLVASSNGYKDLWGPFFNLFHQHWPDCPFPVYLGAQTARADSPGVQTLEAGAGAPWGGSLQSFLNDLDFENVLLLLEDFFLCETVSTAKMLEHLAALRVLGGTVLRLYPNPPPTIGNKEFPALGEQHRLAPFRVSLQASLWNTRALRALLRRDESPWEFELQGTLRSQTQSGGFYCTWKPEFPYRHVVEKGEWFWTAARRYRRANIGCDFSLRGVMSPWRAARKAGLAGWRRLRGRMLMWPLRSCEVDPYAELSRASHKTLASGRSLRVAFLTNMIPPYHKPVLRLLAQRYAAFRVLLSTPMEFNRPWKVDWDGLDVVVQKTSTIKSQWRHQRGFSESLAVHIPLDTLGQLRRFSPDVVISAEMGARTLLAMVFRKLHRRSRLIVWAEAAESTETGRGLARHIARKVFVKNADAFLAVGGSAVKYLERMGAAPAKVFKIAYTTDNERFAMSPPTRAPQQAQRLLFCGQLVERKGLIPFLRVLSRWANDHPGRSVEFALAGDGPLRHELTQLPLAGNVKLEFLGVFQYDHLPEVYASAGVFVLPSLADTWAVVVNEALVSGLPVLGSVYAQAVQELVRDGYNGWIFTPDDAEDAYRAIDRMMNTAGPELELMRAHAREVASQLNPDRVAALIGAAVHFCTGV
jgi:glycosyltransferase involved in cell wall biosynthesis